MSKHEIAIDALEQYSHANCLILHGTKFVATNNQQESTSYETERCESRVLKSRNVCFFFRCPLHLEDFSADALVNAE